MLNLVLGYLTFNVHMKIFNLAFTEATTSAQLDAYQRSLFSNIAGGAVTNLEATAYRQSVTDLVEKIDDLGQTVRLLMMSSSHADQQLPTKQRRGSIPPFILTAGSVAVVHFTHTHTHTQIKIRFYCPGDSCDLKGPRAIIQHDSFPSFRLAFLFFFFFVIVFSDH